MFQSSRWAVSGYPRPGFLKECSLEILMLLCRPPDSLEILMLLLKSFKVS